MYSIRLNLDLGVKYLIGCDATADVDDVLISLSLTFDLYCNKSKIPDHVLYRIGPKLAPWSPGGSVMIQQTRLAGTKRGDIHYAFHGRHGSPP